MRAGSRLDRRGLTIIAVVGTTVVVVAVAWMLLRGRPIEALYARWMFHNGPPAIVMLWMARLVLRRRPGHGAGLVLLAIGALGAAHVGVSAVVDAGFAAAGVDDLAPGATFVPAELPLEASIAMWVMSWLWIPLVVLALTMLLLVFPDGHLPSPRWRWAAVVAAVGTALLMVAHGWVTFPTRPLPTSSQELPAAYGSIPAALTMAGGTAVLAAALASITALVGRWRAADVEQRRVFRAVGAAAIVFALVGTLTWPWQEIWRPAVLVGLLTLVVTYALAVARLRLHDLDPVIGRAAVGAILAAGVTGVYLVIVVGVGSVVGGRVDGALLPLVAVAVVAVLIEPARRQARRLVDRLLYGRDTDRTQVLSELAELASTATSAEEILKRAADLLVRGTGAERAEILLEIDGDRRPAAASGTSEVGAPTIATPVIHHDERLGEVRLFVPHPSDLVGDADRLLRDVAHSLGVALRNARLTAELRAQLVAIERSRQRLVEVHDEVRRDLERDIHDGAQARLIALRLRLGAVRSLAAADGNAALERQLDALGREVDAAVRSLRELARGLHPPVLEHAGIDAALRAHARDLPLPVSVRADGIGRYERTVEGAIYFCCLEALQNAARHADADRITVELTEDRDTVRFAVVDDGAGFDPATTGRGSGMTNVDDRLTALGGRVHVRSAPGEGTVVRGEVPLHAPVSER